MSRILYLIWPRFFKRRELTGSYTTLTKLFLHYFFNAVINHPMKNIRHQVAPHFSVEALKQKYLNCQPPRERTHWHIIWLLAQTDTPKMPREVAAIVGCTPDCVRKLLRPYDAQGEDALTNGKTIVCRVA